MNNYFKCTSWSPDLVIVVETMLCHFRFVFLDVPFKSATLFVNTFIKIVTEEISNEALFHLYFMFNDNFKYVKSKLFIHGISPLTPTLFKLCEVFAVKIVVETKYTLKQNKTKLKQKEKQNKTKQNKKKMMM